MVRSMLGPGWALALLLLAHGIDRGRVVTPCGSRSDRKAPCLGVRGRVSLTNGNPNVRVWHVGTKRVFGVVGIECTEHPCGPSAMPDSLWAQMDENHDLFADLIICPVTHERAGWMQWPVSSLPSISASD